MGLPRQFWLCQGTIEIITVLFTILLDGMSALPRNTTLKRLGLRGNKKINTSGWGSHIETRV